MVVASANDFRANQKKYIFGNAGHPSVFKRGSDLLVITTVSTKQRVNVNPVWAEHIKKAEQEIKSGKVTTIKSSDIWKYGRKCEK